MASTYRRRRTATSDGGDWGLAAAGAGATALAGIASAFLHKKKKEPGEAKEKDDEPDLAPADSKYQDYLKATGSEDGLKSHRDYAPGMDHHMYMENQKVQDARAALARIATMGQTQHQTNELAATTRMGGRYTGEGLQLAEQNANLNAQDRLRARSIIGEQTQDQMRARAGIGGTMSYGLGY